MKTYQKYLLLGLLYTTQTIPIAFVGHALPAIMREKGLSLETIALFQVSLLPYAFNFLWAPLIDQYGKTYFKWITWSTLIYGLALLPLMFLGFNDMVSMILLVTIAVFGMSTQDLAIDAYAIRSLSDKEKSVGNGIQSGGNYLGYVVGGGLLLIGYNALGWENTIFIVAVLTTFPFLLTLKYGKYSPKSSTAVKVNLRDIFSYFKVKQFARWIPILLILKLPLEMVFYFIKPLLIDKHYSLEEVGLLFGIITMCFAMAGGLFAGWFLKARSNYTKLLTAIIGTIFCLLSVFCISEMGSPATFITVVVCSLIGIVTGWNTMVVYYISMSKVRQGKEATDYSFQIFLRSILFMGMIPIGGKLATQYGYGVLFGTMTIIAILTFAMVLRLGKEI